MSDKKVQIPEVGSEWVVKKASDRVTVLAIDIDNPLGPRVVFRYPDGIIGICSVDEFYKQCDPAPPPMPTVADRWIVVNRGGAFIASYATEAQADDYARRFDPHLLVAHHPCVEVREPRPAGEASDG